MVPAFTSDFFFLIRDLTSLILKRHVLIPIILLMVLIFYSFMHEFDFPLWPGGFIQLFSIELT